MSESQRANRGKSPPSVRAPRARAAQPARAYHHGDLRRALIDAARQQLAAAGAHGLSLREVSRAAGVSHSAAYRHFPSKAVLLAALAEGGFRELTQAMQQEIATRGPDPIAQLKGAGVGYVGFGVARPALLQLMFSDQVGHRGDHPALDDAAKAAYLTLSDLTEAAQRAGRLRPGDPGLLSLALWTQVHGLALLYAADRIGPPGQRPPPSDQVADALGDLLFGGMADTRGQPRGPTTAR